MRGRASLPLVGSFGRLKEGGLGDEGWKQERNEVASSVGWQGIRPRNPLLHRESFRPLGQESATSQLSEFDHTGQALSIQRYGSRHTALGIQQYRIQEYSVQRYGIVNSAKTFPTIEKMRTETAKEEGGCQGD